MKADQKVYVKKYMAFIQERKDVLKQFGKILKTVGQIPDGNNKLLDQITKLAKDTITPVRIPQIKPSSFLHADDLKDGMDWLTKIFTINKEVISLIKQKRA